MANSYNEAVKQAFEDVRRLKAEYESMQKSIIETASTVSQMMKGGSSLKELNERVIKVTSSIEKMNEQSKKAIVIDGQVKVKQSELAQSIIALNEQRKKANAERIKEADAIERNKRALQRQKESSIELSRAYVQLVNQQKQARKVLEDLTVSQGKNSAETKKAQKEYDKLTAKVNQANKATSNFSKTGLGSMARGFRNLIGAFGVVGGVQLFASMTQEVFKMVKKLESLDFALKAVTNGTGELIRTQEFLSKISNEYGASIVGTTERYIKFLAAAKQSNVALKDTEEIFAVVTKAAGVLGLRTDELSGIYLALEQMLSKGKVTTEELRRQLGERLPGAFGIMADALGVTTAELDKMLRKGEILSSDALPKFAKQLASIDYLKNAKEIDTVVASQNRLNNSWIELIQNIEEGEGGLSNFFKTLLDGTTSFIDILSKSEQGSESFFEFFRNIGLYANGYGKLVDAMAKQNSDTKVRIQLTSELSELMRRDLKGKVIELEIERRIHELRNLTIEQLSEQIALYNEKEKLINDIVLKDKTLELAELEKKSIEELREIWKSLNKEKITEGEKASKVLKNTLGYFQEQIRLQEELLKNTATTKEEYDEISKSIKSAEDDLDSFIRKMLGVNAKGSIQGLDIQQKGIDMSIFDGVNDIESLIEKLNENKIIIKADTTEIDELVNKLKALSTTKDVFSELTETFRDVFDIDISKFEFLFDEAKNTVKDWAKLSKELIGSVLDATLQKYEIELQEAQRSRDLILNNDFATEEAKENARRKFDEEERRIRTEKAKQEREITLIKIALDTASAIAQATTYLSNPITAPLFPAIVATITGIGLAQAAIVASQPLPQFEDGVTGSKYEGLAIKDEKGAELHLDKKGNIKDLGQNKGAKLTEVKKGDTIIPAFQTKQLLSNFGVEDLQRAVFEMNMASNGAILNERAVDNSLLREITGLKESNEKVWNEVKKLASRPLNIKNKIELKDERAY